MRPVEPEVRPGVRRGDQREGGARRRPHQQRRGHDVPVHQGKHDELGYGMACPKLRESAAGCVTAKLRGASDRLGDNSCVVCTDLPRKIHQTYYQYHHNFKVPNFCRYHCHMGVRRSCLLTHTTNMRSNAPKHMIATIVLLKRENVPVSRHFAIFLSDEPTLGGSRLPLLLPRSLPTFATLPSMPPNLHLSSAVPPPHC